jgi:hypothetical protein
MQTHGLTFPVDPIPFAINNLLDGERCFGHSAPKVRSGLGRRLSPIHIKKALASK